MIFVFSFFTILNSALLSGFVAQIYSFSPFSRVSKRKLYFLTPIFYPLLPCFYSLTRAASCFASGRVRNRISVPYIYYRYKEKTNLLVTPSTFKKKKKKLFLPSHLTLPDGKHPVLSGILCMGQWSGCECIYAALLVHLCCIFQSWIKGAVLSLNSYRCNA